MGMLDILKSFKPENITPQGAFDNPLSNQEIRVAATYANPLHFGYEPPGTFVPAGIYEVNGAEFLQDRWHWPSANVQFVTVPERPQDKGSFDPMYQNGTGIYLQGRQIGIAHQYSGSAPTTGVYTGYYGGDGEFQC